MTTSYDQVDSLSNNGVCNIGPPLGGGFKEVTNEHPFTIKAATFKELETAFWKIHAAEVNRRYYEEQNRIFDRLPKSKQRVSVAKDVLKQLAEGKIVAKRNAFVDHYFRGNPEAQLSDVLNKARQCRTCALGAMFVCAVKKLDKITVGDLNQAAWGEPREATVDDVNVTEYLGRSFSQEQLEMIEIAFENGKGAFDVDEANATVGSTRRRKRARDFCEGTLDSTKRMQKIMRNIIRNGGRFVP